METMLYPRSRVFCNLIIVIIVTKKLDRARKPPPSNSMSNSVLYGARSVLYIIERTGMPIRYAPISHIAVIAKIIATCSQNNFLKDFIFFRSI